MTSKLEKGLKHFVNGYGKLIEVGRKRGSSEEKIEKAQRLYVAIFIAGILKVSGIPKDKQLEILAEVKEKIEKKA